MADRMLVTADIVTVTSMQLEAVVRRLLFLTQQDPTAKVTPYSGHLRSAFELYSRHEL